MNQKTYLLKLRKHYSFTQEQVAEVINTSRQTYALIEKGESELTLNQTTKIANLYGISIQDIADQKLSIPKVNIIKNKSASNTNKMRIDIPQNKIDKFKEILLYILNKVGAKPNVGMTVIYKLLYFIDFDYYEKYETQIMGLSYQKNHYGPTPTTFSKIISEMEKSEDLTTIKNKYFNKAQVKFLPLRSAAMTSFTDEQIAHVDDVLRRLGNKNATELSDLSHQDTPWIAAQQGEVLDYEAVFYRLPETSQRSYGDEI